MRAKRIYRVLALVMALTMCFSMVGCSGKKPDASDPPGKTEETEVKDLFVLDNEDGTASVVTEDGTPAQGYSVDADGNIIGSDGGIVIEAAKVSKLPNKEKPDSPAVDSPEDNQEGGQSSSESASSSSSESGSSGGSSGGSSSGSGSSPSSGGSSSSGGGGDESSSGESNQPAHIHDWQPVYETIEIPVYEQVCYAVCAACGEKFGVNNTDDELVAHMKKHALAGESSRTFSQCEEIQIGTKTAEDLKCYECSCGARKEV